VKSATVISESPLLGQLSLQPATIQPSVSESPTNVAINQQQIVFQPLPDTNPVEPVELPGPCTGAVPVSATGLAIKQEVRPVIGSTPPVIPAVTPSLLPLSVTYATGMLGQPAVGGLQLPAQHGVNVGAGYVTNAAVPLNQPVVQFIQQQQQSAMQTASVPGSLQNVGSSDPTHNTVSSILAAAAATAPKPPVLGNDNVNVQMLLNLLNRGETKAPAVGTVQWPPAPAHSSNTPQGSQAHSHFIVQNFTTVAPVEPQDLSNQLVFNLSPTSFAAPSVVSCGTAPAVVSSVLLAAPVASTPQLTHALAANDQVLNLTLHSSSQRMETNAADGYSSSLGVSQASSFSHVEPNAFVATDKTPTFTAMSLPASTYAEPMAIASHYPTEAQPPPLKTLICMTNTSADTVTQVPVLVHQHVAADMQQQQQQDNSLTEKLYVNAVDTTPPAAVAQQPQFAAQPTAGALSDAHTFGSNVIVHMDVTSSPHPPAKPVQTPTTDLPHDINPTGIVGGSNLEPSSVFLTGSNNPMLADTSSQPQPQNTIDLQDFGSQPVLGMDISGGQMSGLNVPAEPATLSTPGDDNAANSMSSNLQQSLAELLDLQQQINGVNVPVSQSVQQSAVLESPLARELPPAPSESMQWVSSTTTHAQTTTAEVPAASNVVLASANIDTINLLTAADVLSNPTYGQDTNHDMFYSAQPATSYAVVIGPAAGSSQDSSPATWNHQPVQSSYSPLAAADSTQKEVKQEQLSSSGDVVLDLLSMSSASGRPTESHLYSQQTAAEVVTPDFFTSSDVTSPVTSSSALAGTTASDSAQSVIYVVGVDNSLPPPEPVSQPITYIVTANQLPNCNQSPDIGLVQYATPPQIQPAAGSDVHSPTSGGFRVLAADTLPSSSTDPSPTGIQFRLGQPISFGSKSYFYVEM